MVILEARHGGMHAGAGSDLLGCGLRGGAIPLDVGPNHALERRDVELHEFAQAQQAQEVVLAEGIRLVRSREPRLEPVAKMSQLPVGDVDGLERFGVAARGGTYLAVEIRGLALNRIDRDLEVRPGKHQLQVVACRLQEAAIPEQVAAKGREPVAERGVRPLQIKADIQLAGSGVEHRLTKRQP